MVFLYIKNGKRMLPTSKSHPWKKISSSPIGGETPVASMLWWEGPEANDRINWERDVSWRMKGKWLPIIRPGGRRAFNDLSTFFLKGSKEVLFWLFVVLVLLLLLLLLLLLWNLSGWIGKQKNGQDVWIHFVLSQGRRSQRLRCMRKKCGLLKVDVAGELSYRDSKCIYVVYTYNTTTLNPSELLSFVAYT